MAKVLKNVDASIRAKLAEIARRDGENFENVLVRYASERFLYRLSKSVHKDKFLLKGAALLSLWFNERHRPTRDLDFLGFGASDIPTLEEIIKEICRIDFADGLQFLADTVTGEKIREEEAYQGVRLEFRAMLGNARIPIRVDIGFGDAVTPQYEDVEFPTILDSPAARIKVYPKETVIAEKFEAMVRFGIANSRMKDFWDVHLLISEFDFEGNVTQSAVVATFENRRTPFPTGVPIALTRDFSQNLRVVGLWSAFLSRNRIERFTDLTEVIAKLNEFFTPIVTSVQTQTAFNKNWSPRTGWQ